MGLLREDGTPKPALNAVLGVHAGDRAFASGSISRIHRLDDAVAWMKELGVTLFADRAVLGRLVFGPNALAWFDRQMEALARRSTSR